MRHGLSVPNFATPDRLVELAQMAEASGWDGFFLWDHVLGFLERPPPISEPWTVLAAAAVTTSRVRLGTLVTPVPRRRPWVLARQVVTVDHLSGGRAVLGVGLGTPPEVEYGAFGEVADRRVHAEMLDEGLAVIAALWSAEPVAHRGRHFQVEGARFRPSPLQEPRIPIWVAASLPARGGVRRAANWDGIVPLFSSGEVERLLTPEEVAALVDDIRSIRGAGPFEVVVTSAAPDEATRTRFREAGVTWLIEGPAPGPDWLEDAYDIAGQTPPLR